MKKKFWILAVVLAAILALSACGSKSQEDVVDDLNGKLEKLSGYKATAEMTLKMGNEPQTYNIEIWHNKPDYYRVELKNSKKDQSQMILRNKDGVYVLTPTLNKSYKFQSEWPKNSSQAYLYESLVKDILQDKSAKFKTTKNTYVFETKTRYQNNKMLPVQEISFDKRTLTPKSVKVMDTNKNTLVSVKFTKVQLNAKFDKNAFDTKKNLTGATIGKNSKDVNVNGSEFTVKYPEAKIGELYDEKEITTENGKRVILTYNGNKPFTMIQEKATVSPASVMEVTAMNGDMVDLGFVVGEMTKNSLTWTQDGVKYMIASKKLSKNEMIEIAESVQGQPVK
ncbi:outer membrane lipoprotein carrier protein LolA [Bacillus sp. FJAT-49736]|uniref:LolA family protein n=1 Tax=Bacillus sp. FJAT-49736 TaxID=2833582 RepID=UPI001BC909CD|nr:outer membrane lipoprotein carrier protein LolA [Bacillus sp. FJAT-49736]MBS4175486.1 outer membrane lipoprotein carrier protein LolA [Bacillus sp. FJAT-49736]